MGGWYVPPALGGTSKQSRSSCFRAIGAGLLLLALTISLAACGGGSPSNANESEGTSRVRVVKAEFPSEQRLGQTSVMTLGVRNTGEKTVPSLVVTINVAGKEGETTMLPFGIHDPQPGLAQADRPVWVLAARYPRLAGESTPAGARTSSPKTYDFGPLKPGKTVEAIWKLSAVKAGKFAVLYRVAGGLGGKAKAETDGGTTAGGRLAVEITDASPDTEVTDSGEIVEIDEGGKGSKSGK